MVSPFVYAGVNFKLRNVSTKIEGNDQKEVSLYSTNMIKTVVKLYLFIENKELSFNRKSIRQAINFDFSPFKSYECLALQ